MWWQRLHLHDQFEPLGPRCKLVIQLKTELVLRHVRAESSWNYW